MKANTELESRFAEPTGWQWQTRFETRDGQFLRFGYAAPKNPRALVVILPGLSEYVEKYFEMVSDLIARGYATAVIDWRGQGLSWRQEDRAKRFHDDFINDVLDAHAFVNALPFAKLPKILLAHSMGGNIAARMLHDHPDTFSCAIMTAPMFGLPVPEWTVNSLVSGLRFLHMDSSYLPGHGPWSYSHFDMNMKLLTSDDARKDMQAHWVNEKADLRMGGLTVSWLHAALASIRLVRNPAYLGAIKTPTLLLQGTRDMVISNGAIQQVARELPQGELVSVDGALHEIMMERDVYRNQFWTAFDAFVAKYI